MNTETRFYIARRTEAGYMLLCLTDAGFHDTRLAKEHFSDVQNAISFSHEKLAKRYISIFDLPPYYTILEAVQFRADQCDRLAVQEKNLKDQEREIYQLRRNIDVKRNEIDRLGALCLKREKERDEAQRRNQQLETQLREANARLYQRAGEVDELRNRLQETSIRLTAVEVGRSPKVVDRRVHGGACPSVVLVRDHCTGNVEVHDDYHTPWTAGKACGEEQAFIAVPEGINDSNDLGWKCQQLRLLAEHIRKFTPGTAGRYVICGVSRRKPGRPFYVGDDGKLFWGTTPDTSAKLFCYAGAKVFLRDNPDITAKLEGPDTFRFSIVTFDGIEKFVAEAQIDLDKEGGVSPP